MQKKLNEGLKLGLSNTPAFNEKIYGELPPFLQKVCKPFIKTEIERDIILLSSLITLSACFPNVRGRYHHDQINSNLYGIIIGPAGSGKGVAKYGTYLGAGIQKHLEEKQNIELINIENEKSALKEGEVANASKIVKPNGKNFFLPANISSTFLIKQIKENEMLGNMIFDSEADTLANILGQEWGKGVSELLRKAFHHELTSIARATDNLIININDPKLSFLLTGTPGQLGGIIRSVEDGLFSRCLFYLFDADPTWKSVAPANDSKTHQRYYQDLGDEVLVMYNQFLEKKYEYVLADEQWELFNKSFNWLLERSTSEYGDAVQGIVKRCGVIAFRLSMIFNILNHFENKSERLIIKCDDKYLRLSFSIIHSLLIHILEVFRKVNINKIKESSKEEFINSLPEGQFNRTEALLTGRSFGLSFRTIDYYLSQSVAENVLQKHSFGVYLKTKKG